jgi:dipeptidyl-peptidase-4
MLFRAAPSAMRRARKIILREYTLLTRKSFALALQFAVLPLALAFSPAPALHAQASQPWTVKEIFGGPSLTGYAPDQIYWAPDSKQVTYLDGSGNLREFVVGGASARKVIASKQLQPLLNAPISEQDRDHRNRYDEPDYIWAPDSKHLLFDTNGELWLFSTAKGKGRKVGNTGMQSGDDPKFSPNGQYISYIRNNNIYVQPEQDASQARALTDSGSKTVLNGGIDWVYLEELDVRSNYFWSPDSKQIAFLQMNEDRVPLYPIEDWLPVHARIQWWQRYPQPGDPNPGVRVGVVKAAGGPVSWLKIPLDTGNGYIPRFGWVNDHIVWVETLDRAQKHENIYFADTNTGQVKLALAQTEPKYFNTTYDVTFVGYDEFLLLSWRDGHTHIYRYSFDAADPMAAPAKLENEVEHGDYEVMSIDSVDQATGTIYYVSNEGNPRVHQVWAVNLDGSNKHRVSQTGGVHEPKFPPHGSSYIDEYSDMTTPPAVAFCNPQGACHPFWTSTPVTGHDLQQPVLLTLKAADGKTTLYGTLMLPEGKTAAHSVPLIVNPYGGPDVGEATDRWGGRHLFWNELLAQHGFAVLTMDNRGMGARGRAFEQVCYHNFGPPELADQLAAVDQVLQKYPQLDPKRLGWWGWSWGGTFTLYALSHSDRFRVGVSVAPVTSWRDYDSIYTERYMGLPSEDAHAYEADSVQNSVAHLHGHLLLMHGTGDDNVHFENTIQYIQKLIEAGVPYDYNVFPRKTHSIAGAADQTELYNRILQEFELYLMPEQPVPGGAGE